MKRNTPGAQPPQLLPFLANVHLALLLAVAFPIIVTFTEAIFKIELPDQIWTLVGAASMKLFDIANGVLDIYSRHYGAMNHSITNIPEEST